MQPFRTDSAAVGPSPPPHPRARSRKVSLVRNQVRRCLVRGLDATKSLDAGVAFIGTDWADILGTFSGRVRLVCWLSSTNTNPYAVEQMMQRKNIHVTHQPAMHAKVYVLRGDRSSCIVGSANLTGAALSVDGASGQYEAAIHTRSKDVVENASHWFDALWKDAKPIKEVDLSAAKNAWKKARKGKTHYGNRKRRTSGSRRTGQHLPPDWEPTRKLLKLAKQVKGSDFSEFTEHKDLVSQIAERGRRNDVERLISLVARWTGHPGAYKPALTQGTGRIRQAFRILFDHSRSIESRLKELDSGGESKILGFGLSTLTTILYWRIPGEYPAFNRRTKMFLRDFGFEGLLPKTLSPTQYGTWLSFAQELSSRLQLPSAGHIDRLVDRHWNQTGGTVHRQ